MGQQKQDPRDVTKVALKLESGVPNQEIRQYQESGKDGSGFSPRASRKESSPADSSILGQCRTFTKL